MAANNSPIFTRKGDISFNGTTGMAQPTTAAANDVTGAGANNVLVWTADNVNGGFIQRIKFRPAGTNVASLMRVFINNGVANTTAANNLFWDEVILPATTLSATVPMQGVDLFMGLALNPGFRIYVGLATAVAAGWLAIPVGGAY
jgi:hypothetical protein